MSIMQQKVQLYELMLKQGSLDALRLAQDPNSAEQIRKEQIQGEILKMEFYFGRICKYGGNRCNCRT